MNRRAVAAGITGLTFAANLLLQHFLTASGIASRVLIPGLADFQPAWNRGVSFSLFAQDTVTGCHVLVAVLAVISLVIAVMMWRAASWFATIGLALILGGALGNLLDRALYCAVFDFLSLHLGALPLFVCNLPDIFISAGAALLVLEAFSAKPDTPQDRPA